MRTLLSAIMAVAIAATLSSCTSQQQQQLRLGDERSEEYLPLLEGSRVALLSNHTGIVGNVKDGQHILDALLGQGVKVSAVFSPEHGFRGSADAGEHVGNSVDEATGVPILSLYSPGSYKPSKESMDMFDVLVIDIQDVGTRFYTYYITMKRLMEACSESGKKVVILDRPNPNGFFVDGPILDMSLNSGVGALPIPVAHGMTLGELALMMNGEKWLADSLQCDLHVVACEGYTHSMKTPILEAPSPNLKDIQAIYAYPSTCYFEGTIVSLGRGTDMPFKVYGHPDMPDEGFSFTPRSIAGAKNPPCMDEVCYGVDLSDTDEYVGKVDFKYVIDAYKKLGCREDFFLKNGFFDLLTGSADIRKTIIEEAPRSTPEELAARLSESWQDDVAAFGKLRDSYLLYPKN